MNSKILTGIIILGVIIFIFLILIFFNNYGKLSFIIQYKNAKGLKTGDVIYVKGVDIGTIKSIKFDNDIVNVVVIINSDYKDKIPVDSRFTINTDTFLTGKKCIKVKFGKSAEMIKKGDIIDGSSNLLKAWENFKEGIESFLNSKDWQDFEDLIETAYKQGEEDFDKIYKEINEQIDKIYSEAKKEVPEIAEEFKEQAKRILSEYNEKYSEN